MGPREPCPCPVTKRAGSWRAARTQVLGTGANPLGDAKSEGIVDVHDPIRASTAGNYRYNFPGSMVEVPRRQFRPPLPGLTQLVGSGPAGRDVA